MKEHNPDDLSAEQVNPPLLPYRLLDEDEIKIGCNPVMELEIWDGVEWEGYAIR